MCLKANLLTNNEFFLLDFGELFGHFYTAGQLNLGLQSDYLSPKPSILWTSLLWIIVLLLNLHVLKCKFTYSSWIFCEQAVYNELQQLNLALNQPCSNRPPCFTLMSVVMGKHLKSFTFVLSADSKFSQYLWGSSRGCLGHVRRILCSLRSVAILAQYPSMDDPFAQSLSYF